MTGALGILATMDGVDDAVFLQLLLVVLPRRKVFIPPGRVKVAATVPGGFAVFTEEDVLGAKGRKVLFHTATGRTWVRGVDAAPDGAFQVQD